MTSTDRPACFVKKPVKIQALQVLDNSDNHQAIRDWFRANTPKGTPLPVSVQITASGPELVIHTLEGDMHASIGDWIIRGVRGEFYPCKPDIFDATYEPVSS